MFVRRQATWWRAKICIAPLEELQQGPPLMETKRSAHAGPEWGGFVRGGESCGRTYTRGAWYPYIQQVHLQASPSSVIPHRWMRACIGYLDPSAGGRGIRDGTWLCGHWHDERLSTGSPSDLLIRYQTTSRSP